MHPSRLILPLSLVFLTNAENGFFESLDPCDSVIKDKFRRHLLPEVPEMLLQLNEHWPWKVTYATYKDPKVKWAEFRNDKIEVKIIKDGDSTATEVQTKDVNWNDLLRGETSNGLQLHIWKFEIQSLVFGYYLCKDSGSLAVGESKTHFGAAVTYSNRIGGFPSEANDCIRAVKFEMRDVFGADIPPQDLPEDTPEEDPSEDSPEQDHTEE